MRNRLTKGLVLGAGAAGLAAVAVLGSGIASAAGGNPPPPPSGSTPGGSAPGPAPSGAPATRPTPSPGSTAAPAAPGQAPPGGQAGPRQGGPGTGGPGVVHGRFVRQSGTSFVTEDVQQGKVTAVSATSLTVVSADDFSETYVLTSSTTYGRDGSASDIAVGDTVHVRATVADGTATATSVEEPPAPRPTASPSASS